MQIELSRTTVRLTGDDRVLFLNNFCTADIKQMAVGDVREAFILNIKGKLIGHVLVFCHEDRLELDTVPNQAEELIQHLDRYLIREDVEMSEVELHHVFCFGSLDAAAGWEVAENQFKLVDDIQVANCEVAGTGYLLSSESSERLSEFVAGLEQQAASEAQLAFHRLESGTPWFGVDSTNDTLPQELQRDEKAISFTKGCYLGQETVARIDSLGRVNKLLIRLTSEQPLQVGNHLRLGEKTVGTVSSAASQNDQHVGLAIVRREAAASGTRLQLEAGEAVVA